MYEVHSFDREIFTNVIWLPEYANKMQKQQYFNVVLKTDFRKSLLENMQRMTLIDCQLYCFIAISWHLPQPNSAHK